MRRALLACLLAGCYHASDLACAVSCASDQSCPSGLQCGLSDHLCHAGVRDCSEIDAGVPPRVDAPNPDASIAPFCDRSKDTLLACFQFENNTRDGSQYMLPANPTGVMFKPSMTGLGQALQLTGDTNVQIAETTHLDLQTFTVEAWLFPSSTNNHNVSVVNNGGQYGMFVDINNAAFCAKITAHPPLNQSPLVIARAPAPLALNQWTHVACVYDGTILTLYLNGTQSKTDLTGGDVATNGMQGTGIGSDSPMTAREDRYVGLLDNVRIWSTARKQADLCADAAPKCP
jgi:hypothetical protein